MIGPRQARRELVLLLVALLVALGALAVLGLAAKGRIDRLTTIDAGILRALRSDQDPGRLPGPWWVTDAVRDVTALGSEVVLSLVGLAAFGALVIQGRRRTAVLLAAALLGGWLASTGLKQAIGRVRPDVVPPLVRVASASFPSGHAMLSAVVYLTVGAVAARAASRMRMKLYLVSVALALTFLVGASRVALGVHYPTDVLGGWIAGCAWALLWWLVVRRLQERGAVEPERHRATATPSVRR